MTTVYVLIHEWGSEEDATVAGVFATEAAAEAAKRDAIRNHVAHGDAVWWDPETDACNEHWEHDYRIEAWDVQGEAPSC